MALRAGYFGLKCFERNKLLDLAASIPADIGPDNPIASKSDISATVDLLKDTTGWTGKNRFKNDANSVEVIGNITITKLADGSIDVDTGGEGASTDYYWSRWKNTYNNPNTYDLPEGYYILSTGQPRTSDYDVYVQNRLPDDSGWDNTSSVYDNTGEGSAPWYHDADLTYNVSLHIKRGAILNHKVFKPMFTTPEIHKLSPEFEPYHESVEEMLTPKLLTSANDIDDVKTYGDYYWEQSYPTHSPEDNTFGALRVFPCGEVIHQMVIRGAGSSASIYIRRFQETWSNWFKFSGTEIVPASLTKATKKKKVIKEEE